MTLSFDVTVERGDFRLELALEVPPGVTVLYGPSGSGKTVTLHALAGLAPAKGRIALGGRTLLDGTTRLPPHQRRLGLVPQEGLLFPHLSVLGNLRYGGERDLDEVVSVLELGPLLDRSPRALSGGERQRVALGRALLAAPEALLLDEPLAALDRERRARIVPFLRRVKERFSAPVLYVTHALDEALALGDRACVIASGKTVAEGAPLDVFGAPRAELVPRLTGFENVLGVTVVEHVAADGVTRARHAAPDTPGVELVVPLLAAKPGERAFVGLGASEVVLAGEEPRALSARNILPATIAELDGSTVRLDLGGVPLVARVVPSAARALSLEPGRKVFVVIKTTSFRPLELA